MSGYEKPLKQGCKMPTGHTRDMIIEKLADLLKQATTERSHYYVASCVTEAMQEIKRLRTERDCMRDALVFIASRENLTFAECSIAEEIINRATSALRHALLAELSE